MDIPVGTVVVDQLFEWCDAVREDRVNHHDEATVVEGLIVPDQLLPLIARSACWAWKSGD
jgi:hypothetical protein